MNIEQTFLFDTGVRAEELRNPPYRPYPGHKLSPNGVVVIPFTCEDVPAGATFAFAADDPTLAKDGLICRVIKNSALLSKYAFFKPPLKKEGTA